MTLDPTSVLFVTLDSCRYDTFEAADAPNLKRVGPLHRALAPAAFLKMRDSNHAKGIWEFTVGEHGLAIGDKLEGLTGILGWTALRDDPSRSGS